MKSIFIAILAGALVLQLVEGRPEAAGDAKNPVLKCVEIDPAKGQGAVDPSNVEKYRKVCTDAGAKNVVDETVYRAPGYEKIIMHVEKNVPSS